MERLKHEENNRLIARLSPSNDNRKGPVAISGSTFPEGAVARIYRPWRPVTRAVKKRRTGWRLVFERRSAPFIEPLMGYTGSDDTLTQVELYFPSLQTAIAYAMRQGLPYVVQKPVHNRSSRSKDRPSRPSKSTSRAFSEATLDRLGLSTLRESYGHALDCAENGRDSPGVESWSSPMDIVYDPMLSLAAKRSILMNWAWTEYLVDQATNEGMPENNRPSRLDEVEQALLALERGVEQRTSTNSIDRAAA